MISYSKARYPPWNYEKNEIFCSRDMTFNEKQTNLIKKVNKEQGDDPEIQAEVDVQVRPNDLDNEPQEDNASNERS